MAGMQGNLQFQFQNKTAVITGGAQGIGFQIALQFLEAGAKVSIWDYSEQALDNAKTELSRFTSQLHLAKVDVGQRESCAQAVASLPWAVDILVNIAPGATALMSSGCTCHSLASVSTKRTTPVLETP